MYSRPRAPAAGRQRRSRFAIPITGEVDHRAARKPATQLTPAKQQAAHSEEQAVLRRGGHLPSRGQTARPPRPGGLLARSRLGPRGFLMPVTSAECEPGKVVHDVRPAACCSGFLALRLVGADGSRLTAAALALTPYVAGVRARSGCGRAGTARPGGGPVALALADRIVVPRAFGSKDPLPGGPRCGAVGESVPRSGRPGGGGRSRP